MAFLLLLATPLLANAFAAVDLSVTEALSRSLPQSVQIQSLKVTYRGPKPKARHRLRASLAASPKKGKARLRIDHIDGQGSVRNSGWAIARLTLCGPVLVATRDLRAGGQLTAADLTQQTRCHIDLEAVDLPAADLYEGKLRRSLHRGAVIRSMDVSRRPLVQRNRRVTLRYRRGALTVRSAGRALENGGMGDSVMVQRNRQRGSLTATVIGKNLVEIEP